MIFTLFLATQAWILDDSPRPAIDLGGISQFGEIRHAGRSVIVVPCSDWGASGIVLDDGSVLLLWVHYPAGRAAISVYRLEDTKPPDDARLVGRWAWVDEAEYDAWGVLIGGHESVLTRRRIGK